MPRRALSTFLTFLFCLEPFLVHALPRAHSPNQNLWFFLRQHFSLSSAPHEEEAILKQIAWYQKHPESLRKTIERATYYLHFITARLISHQMPTEIALIPIIESQYDPFAYSHAGARGIWQIMPSLGSGYGLTQNHWVDERRDVVLSTNSAIKHLQYLQQVFDGDWKLAIYAYNGGEGRIKNALKPCVSSRKTAQCHALLPKETKEYVPKILALQRIILQPDYYGIELPHIPNKPFFLPAPLEKPLAFAQISEVCGISNQTLRALNPSARRHSIKQTDGHAHVLLPADEAFACVKKLTQHAQLPTANWTYHTLSKKQESIDTIAKKHRTTPQSIKLLNWIEQKERFPPGKLQHLLIQSSKRDQKKPRSLPALESLISADTLPGPLQSVHITKPGDTLSALATKYRTKPEKIIYWNKQAKLKPMLPQQTLVIWSTPAQKTYTVKPGDTLYAIARAHGVDVESLKKANKMYNTTIKPQQQLTIPKHATH